MKQAETRIAPAPHHDRPAVESLGLPDHVHHFRFLAATGGSIQIDRLPKSNDLRDEDSRGLRQHPTVSTDFHHNRARCSLPIPDEGERSGTQEKKRPVLGENGRKKNQDRLSHV